jgi:membrane associated rhomboid family serine protease
MFFLIPVGVDYRTRRYPVVTFTIIGLCTLIWLVQLAVRINVGSEVDDWVFDYLWFTPSISHWWTHLTWMFVHEGFFHLAGNMVYLFLFGSCVEDWIGRPRFVALFLLTGFAAELAHVAVSGDHFASEIPLGGASGAISGCLGAFVMLFAKTKIEFKWVFLLWFRIWSGEFFFPAWLVISFWFLEDLGQMFLTVGQEGAGVAFGAHVGGTMAGVLLMMIQKRFPARLPFDEEEEEVETVSPVNRPPLRSYAQAAAVGAAPAVVEKPTVYLHMSGAQCGPYTESQIHKMFVTGEIADGTLYWQEGMEDWSVAEELRPPGWN